MIGVGFEDKDVKAATITHNQNDNFFIDRINLIPLSKINETVWRPDYRFLIRYFDCFVNFVRQLVAINFDVAQQLGGKRRKSRRRTKKSKSSKRKGRKIRRSRIHRK